MDFTKSSESRRFDVKYASYDALNTKKKYSHVQSKVKVYLDNLKKEDRERRRAKFTRHRSEPSQLAEWKSSDRNSVKFDESSTDWKLVLAKKEQEFNELKWQLDEMKSYGETMSALLSNETLKRKAIQKKLDVLQEKTRIVNSCTWSDPGDHCYIQPSKISEDERQVAVSDYKEVVFDEAPMFMENDVFQTCSNNVGSDEEIADETDETILLQSVEVKSVRKGMKYRLKKIFRCCTPCIKSKVV